MDSQGEYQNVVIVGAGICGLATALGLHRKRIRCLVLEKAASMRTEGSGIDIFANGWRALDQLRVGTELRTKSIAVTEIHEQWLEENRMRVFPCSNVEVRCVRRKDLIEILANNLPANTLRFNCQITAISTDPATSFPVLHTSDGMVIKAKIVIGCDGLNSIVAKSLGLVMPKSFPTWVLRGFTPYPDGHSFGTFFYRIRNKHLFLGRVPVDDRLVHWFIAPMNPFKDLNDLKDPKLIRDFAVELLQKFPSEVIEMVKASDLSSISLRYISYRPPWQLMLNDLWRGTMVLAGDAMHVMGPFLGQGGCASIEDGVVLARCISQKLPADSECTVISDKELHERIEAALSDYVKERKLRVIGLSTNSYLIGSITGTSSWVKKLLCIIILVLFFKDSPLCHSDYDCGKL
ncbi:uncharacterized protein LOC109722795 isoform X2 [Ananas comosus]|uniref:Uncharacterized protein LOC109722795 isoform X2 n=1 Tax=Ananas comosus TaxID=4615 RepID=A0A6P5GD41_ANACO|nr:uncharacterized protein LOC109722795 isoform X2 [Ananas comosus]